MKSCWLALPLVVAMVSAHADQPKPKNTWEAMRNVCQAAGGDYCQTWASGGFEMLIEVHAICPDRHLDPPKIWAMVNEYYASKSSLDMSKEGPTSLSTLVRKAAIARYPCPPHH